VKHNNTTDLQTIWRTLRGSTGQRRGREPDSQTQRTEVLW